MILLCPRSYMWKLDFWVLVSAMLWKDKLRFLMKGSAGGDQMARAHTQDESVLCWVDEVSAQALAASNWIFKSNKKNEDKHNSYILSGGQGPCHQNNKKNPSARPPPPCFLISTMCLFLMSFFYFHSAIPLLLLFVPMMWAYQ